jgi:hypothetical protein
MHIKIPTNISIKIIVKKPVHDILMKNSSTKVKKIGEKKEKTIPRHSPKNIAVKKLNNPNKYP